MAQQRAEHQSFRGGHPLGQLGVHFLVTGDNSPRFRQLAAGASTAKVKLPETRGRSCLSNQLATRASLPR